MSDDAPQAAPASNPSLIDSTPPAEPAATSAPQAPAAPTAPPAQPASTGRSRTVGIVAALAVGALVGGVSGAGAAILALSNNDSSTSINSTTPQSITVNNADDATLITAVAAKASPSVVTISVTGQNGAGTGSGVVLTNDGYVLTNTHVVTLDGSTADPTVRVETFDGRLLTASVVGTDPISDLAVIKVEGATNLQPAEFADSSDLNVGDTAIAIGAPLGLAGTVTSGVISALNRSITVASSAVPDSSGEDAAPETPTPDQQSPFDFWNFDMPGQQQQSTASSTISLSVIQTDAAINPGNSGGALLDSEGKVIGINVAIASAGGSSGQSGSIGVGFAIPSNLAQRIAAELREDGTATHGLLGASVVDVQEDSSQSDANVVGASIMELVSGGAAEAAGLKVGDIVTRFNGIPITGKTDLTAQVRALAAGAEAELVYVRDGTSTTVEVTLGTLQ